MPGLDRTGPWGEGPRTGRGLGRCTPEGRRLLENYGPWFGRGFGWGWRCGFGGGFGWRRGFGRGRGRWRWFWGPGFGWGWRRWLASLSPDERRALLEEEAQFYRQRLEEIEKDLTPEKDEG